MSVHQLIKDSQMQKLMEEQGITRFTAIQKEAIRKGLLYHGNLLVSSPSGSGKTLIGVLGIANTLFLDLGLTIYLVPYKALAMQKEEDFNTLFKKKGLHAKAITGDTDPDKLNIEGAHILITTYEKLDALIRQQNDFISLVKTIVIDEIHELGGSRGASLEFLLIRLFSTIPFVQVIGLSATVNNPGAIKEWLNSLAPDSRGFRLIRSEKRPVELVYKIEITDNKIRTIRKHITRVLSEDGQVLIFVNRRKDCPKLCEELKKTVIKFLSDKQAFALSKLKRTLKEKRSLAKKLIGCVEFGIAFHNASLGKFERTSIEGHYLNRTIKVLVATTTLAAGLNTPARTVLIHDIIQWRKHHEVTENDYEQKGMMSAIGGFGVVKPHSKNMMFQMLGRAGRKGYDEMGEGIILVKNMDEARFTRTYYFQKDLRGGKLAPRYADVTSQINRRTFLQEMILVLISEHNGISVHRIREYLNRSLFAHEMRKRGRGAEDLLQYLFIVPMSPSVLLENYGSMRLIRRERRFGEEVLIKIKTVHGNRISATIEDERSIHHCSLTLREGFRCSCMVTAKKARQRINDNKFRYSLCPHITYLLYSVWFKKSRIMAIGNKHKETPKNLKKLKKILANLLPLLLKHEYILPYLVRNNLVGIHRKGSYVISRLGKLAIKLFLGPEKFIGILAILKKRSFRTEKMRLEKVLQIYLSRKGSGNKYGVYLSVVSEWIDEQPLEDIRSRHDGIGVGDIFYLIHQLERICGILETISLYAGRVKLGGKFHTLGKRILHGIKKELIPLMDHFENLSRRRARILFEAGYRDPFDLKDQDLPAIRKNTGLPLRVIDQFIHPEHHVKRDESLLDYMF